jgi:phosphoheptose isomerase
LATAVLQQMLNTSPTSGNSKNVIKALSVAKHFGMAMIGMTSEGGGHMASL